MNTGINFQKLRESIDWSLSQLQKPRKTRLESIRQYVGYHYGDGGADFKVPVNFLELATTIYVRQLAAHAPQVMVTAKNRELRPYARNMELALNQVPEEIGLEDTLHTSVIEALFSLAVVKIGLCETGESRLDQAYGRVFIDPVSIDDYFCDMSAKARNRIQFEGNDYWEDVDIAREMMGQKNIEPDDHTLVGDAGEERAESVSSSEGAEVYRDRVWLRDVWLPDRRQLLTYGVTSKKILRTVDWDGPQIGPYEMLGFSKVPGNLLPLAPIVLWRDLHDLANSLFRKLGRQADAKKTVAAFAGGNEESVNALKGAMDGEGIRYTGSKPDAITVGGIDAPTLAFWLQLRDNYSYFAGNLDSLGGLSPQSDTVGQDRMLSEAASARLQHMRGQVYQFNRRIFRAIAWYEWTDPVRERIVEKAVPGSDLSVSVKWSEETRKGDFLDYNFNIDPHSMQDNSPETKLQKLGVALERFIFPVMDQIEAQGGHIDLSALTGTVAKLSNVPELNDIVVFDSPPMEPGIRGDAAPQGSRSRKPTNTHRTYERVNRPGATRSGKDDVLTRVLMGSGAQSSETAAIGRRVG